MNVKDLVRPVPGVRQISLLRQRLVFANSGRFWESHYARGGTSGGGSYGELARGKANFLNTFVRDNDVQSVVEYGCGDGHQLSLAEYPCYVGLDVSRTAINLCKSRFTDDATKSFFLYDSDCFVDRAGVFACDLSISLDVIYHLIEDRVFDAYMQRLFTSGRRYVVVYSTNSETASPAAHVRHRTFTSWVDSRLPGWRLIETVRGPKATPGHPDFFVYERLKDRG